MAISFPYLSYEQVNPLANLSTKLRQSDIDNQKLIADQIANAFNQQRNPLLLRQGEQEIRKNDQDYNQAEKINPENLLKAHLQNAFDQSNNPYLTQVNRIKAKYAEPAEVADLGSKRANILESQMRALEEKVKVDNPLLAMTGSAGQVGSIQYLQKYLAQHPDQVNQINPLIKNISDALTIGSEAKHSASAYNNARTNLLEWKAMPMDTRTGLIAQARGMGIDPIDAQKRFEKGETIDQMAVKEGFDPNNLPDAILDLTPTDRTKSNQRKVALAEIKSLDQNVSKAIAPYAARMGGFSPLEVVQGLKGTNKHERAAFYAARALQPELASIRQRMAGGNVTRRGIEEMIKSSLGNIKVYEGDMGSDVYIEMQDLMDKWLTRATETANKQLTSHLSSEQANKLKPSYKPSKEEDPLGRFS